MKPHLVSILIPHHSRPALLKKTLQSCFAQTYKNIEIIVIDDGSSKEDVEEAEKMLTDERCLLVKCPRRRGPSHARNLGLEVSRGEFIQFLDSDDVIHPRKIELQKRFIRSVESKVADQFVHPYDRLLKQRLGSRLETYSPRVKLSPVSYGNGAQSVSRWRFA